MWWHILALVSVVMCVLLNHILNIVYVPLWWLDRLFFCMCKLWNISLCFSQFVFTTRALKLFSLFFCPLTHVHTCTRLCDVWWNYTVYIPYGDLSGYFFARVSFGSEHLLCFSQFFTTRALKLFFFFLFFCPSINTCMYLITKESVMN